jgi:hypothetical protein
LRELTVGEVLNDALRVKVPFTPGTFRAYRRQSFHNRARGSWIRLDANAIIDG